MNREEKVTLGLDVYRKPTATITKIPTTRYLAQKRGTLKTLGNRTTSIYGTAIRGTKVFRRSLPNNQLFEVRNETNVHPRGKIVNTNQDTKQIFGYVAVSYPKNLLSIGYLLTVFNISEALQINIRYLE